MLDAHIEYLMERGWELACPVDDGFIMTMYTGDGSPPLEDSQFDETGYDLAGNTVDDYHDEWDDDES